MADEQAAERGYLALTSLYGGNRLDTLRSVLARTGLSLSIVAMFAVVRHPETVSFGPANLPVYDAGLALYLGTLIGIVAILASIGIGSCLSRLRSSCTSVRSGPAGVVAVCILVGLSGCTALPGTLDITERTVEETESGDVRITVKVKNTDGEFLDKRVGTVFCNVTVGERAYEDDKRVSLQGQMSRRYAFDFGVSYAAFEDDGEFVCGIR